MKTTIYTIIVNTYAVGLENGERYHISTASRGVALTLKQARELITKEINEYMTNDRIVNLDMPYSVTQHNMHSYEIRFYLRRGQREHVKHFTIFENELL